jgi:hypothetical protein
MWTISARTGVGGSIYRSSIRLLEIGLGKRKVVEGREEAGGGKRSAC